MNDKVLIPFVVSLSKGMNGNPLAQRFLKDYDDDRARSSISAHNQICPKVQRSIGLVGLI
jgi:hypothetical protein